MYAMYQSALYHTLGMEPCEQEKVWIIFQFADGNMKLLFFILLFLSVLAVGVKQTRFEKQAIRQHIKPMSIAMHRKSQLLMDHYILEALICCIGFGDMVLLI